MANYCGPTSDGAVSSPPDRRHRFEQRAACSSESLQDCMDSLATAQHHAPMRMRPYIKRLDDCFGDFLVRVVCECGAVREIQPQALARLVGWKMTLRELALRMRCSRCGKKAAEVVAVARPRPRGVPKNSH